MHDVPPMSARVCVVCAEPLLSSARVDKTTCGPGCRTRLCRARKATRNGSATPSGATAPRSGGQESREPVRSQSGPLGASSEAVPASPISPIPELGMGPGPRPTNPVILALVVALRDVEQQRGRGKVLTDVTTKRTAA